jgi:hypothetical protein
MAGVFWDDFQSIFMKIQLNNIHIYLKSLPILFLLTAILGFFNVYYEVDTYRGPYYQAQLNESIFDFTNSAFQEIGFSFLQNLFVELLSFEVFTFLCIFVALSIKLFGLVQTTKNPTFLFILPYIFVFSFIHEAIQIRAALALSVVYIAIIFFANGRKFFSLLILCLAATFHLSTLIFTFVFLSYGLFIQYRKIFYASFMVVVILTVFLPSLGFDLMRAFQIFDSRYIPYIEQESQNKTGLFQYFFIFIGFLLFSILYLFEPKNQQWTRIYNLSIVSGYFAFTCLLIFNASVIIASRLADLLIFPLVVVMGALLVQLQKEKRYFLLIVLLLILTSYCLLRGAISFMPSFF